MHLIQFEDQQGQRRVGVVERGEVQQVRGATSTRTLALEAIRAGVSLESQVQALGLEPGPAYADLLDAGRLLPPLDHEDPAHCLVTGTGLTHLTGPSTN